MADPHQPQLPPEAAAFAARLVPLCQQAVDQAGAAAAMMALAAVAGQLVGAASTDKAHLEEGLSIFAGMMGEEARARFAAGTPSSSTLN